MIESIEGPFLSFPAGENHETVEVPPGIYLFQCEHCDWPDQVTTLTEGTSFHHTCRGGTFRVTIFLAKKR